MKYNTLTTPKPNLILDSAREVDFSTKSDVATGVQDFEGRNLIVGGSNAITKTDYLIHHYPVSHEIIENEKYTYQIEGSLPEGKTGWLVFQKNGFPFGAALSEELFDPIKEEWWQTFSARINASYPTDLDRVSVYSAPDITGVQTTIRKIYFHKSSDRKPYQPAPEDLAHAETYQLSKPIEQGKTYTLSIDEKEEDWYGIWLGESYFAGYVNESLTFEGVSADYLILKSLQGTTISKVKLEEGSKATSWVPFEWVPVGLLDLTPHFLRGTLEYNAIIDVEERILGRISYNLSEAKNNKNILQLNESGLEVWENILNIYADTITETLAFRRERVLNRLLTKPPFTEKFLRDRLDEILGIGNYTLTVNNNNYEIVLESVMENQMWVKELYITMNTVKPVNMVYINKAATSTNLLISELISYEKNFWNYRLDTWKLSEALPFESASYGGVIKMATSPSITSKGIEFALQGVETKVDKARINDSLLVDITSKTVSGNQLIIEFKVLESQVNEITKIELVDSSSNVISGTENSIYVQVIDDVDIKSVYTLRQGV